MDYLVYNMATLSPSLADMSLLPPDEQARGERYTLIRTLLRQELARRCALPPQDILFSYNTNGKPDFAPQPFNMSHSGDCLCLAFHHKAIGVDVERICPSRPLRRLAPRFMCDRQLRQFEADGCPADAFYACWCTAEALVKHAGDTMWHAQQYPFLYNGGRIECLFPHAPAIRLFTPMPGYCGAVAFTLD